MSHLPKTKEMKMTCTIIMWHLYTHQIPFIVMFYKTVKYSSIIWITIKASNNSALDNVEGVFDIKLISWPRTYWPAPAHSKAMFMMSLSMQNGANLISN